MPNRLVSSVSPYLQQHADNPVDWREWGDEAFAQARELNRPIFLSIGYSTCHWCHVMAEESFSNAGVADLLNRYFVAIKVDREERPDVDRIYMTYVQTVTGHGGWPLSVWLTPELKPFFGGTYFPLDDRGNQAGIKRILQSIGQGWEQDRQRITAESDRMLDQLTENQSSPPAGEGEPDLTEPGGDAFERAYTYLFENFDAEFGGFGGAPKFPRPMNLDFLLRCAALQGVESESGREAIGMVEKSLTGMIRGGVHDLVGGGFHRYAVDDAWRLPHFEKMLYDQAQIAANLLSAFEFSNDRRFAQFAQSVLDYVDRDLKHSSGAFWAAEDADSAPPDGSKGGKKEGAFYLWKTSELRELAGDDFAWFSVLFDIQETGNIPGKIDPREEMQGLNVLHQKQSLAEVARQEGSAVETIGLRLEDILSKLRQTRDQRPRPHRDDKVVVAWNGLMIASFARASVLLEELSPSDATRYRESAISAAVMIQDQLWDSELQKLRRVWRNGKSSSVGFAEDYAGLIHGLLELYDATYQVNWLRWADELQNVMDTQFWDGEGGGYFQTAANDSNIILRLKEHHDGAEPSANAQAAMNLFRLALLLGNQERRKRGLQVIQSFRPQWTETPWSMPAMLMAMEWELSGKNIVTISGSLESPKVRALLKVARSRRNARWVVLASSDEEGESWLKSRVPGYLVSNGQEKAQVCRGESCRGEATTPEELLNLLET